MVSPSQIKDTHLFEGPIFFVDDCFRVKYEYVRRTSVQSPQRQERFVLSKVKLHAEDFDR